MDLPDITYKVSKSDLRDSITEILTELVQDQFTGPYANLFVDLKTACKILNISKPTMYRYIKSNVITPAECPFQDKLHAFTIKQLLEFNIARAKKLR